MKILFKFIKDEIIYFHDCFEKFLLFDCKLSEFDIADVIASILSLLSDEIDLKRYFRINALLKFMQCVLASSRWRKTFEKKHANSFFFITIATNFISIWMRFNQEQKKFLISKSSTKYSSKWCGLMWIFDLKTHIEPSWISLMRSDLMWVLLWIFDEFSSNSR